MPMKPIKRGYKVWNLADSSTGYVLSFDVYAGNNMDSSSDSSGTGSDAYGLRERVVINLCSRVNMQPWTVVAFDNFFYRLSFDDRPLQTPSVLRTVRVHRKGLPEMMKKKQKLKRGKFMSQIKMSRSREMDGQ